MKLFKKNCIKCDKLFRPNGRSNRICDVCKSESRKISTLKQRAFWKRRKEGK